jgi:ABC-2 type transport system ATP-binding protein
MAFALCARRRATALYIRGQEQRVDTLLEIEGLTKRFGPITAVDGVTFSVARGEVLGFLGPNGAGKSTTMKMVTGYLAPSAGTARVCGFDVVRQPIEVKRRVGYLPEGAPAYGDMTPDGLLRFVADVRALRGPEKARAIERVVEQLALGSVLHRPIETLSKGFKRRVGLAQALLFDPEVLILDEPTDGLDPNQKHEVRELLRRMAGSKAIVISTHILEEVDAVCTRAIVIADGRIVIDAQPDELEVRSRYRNAVTMRVATDRAETVAEAVRALPCVTGVERRPGRETSATITAFAVDHRDILHDVRDAASRAGAAPEEIYRERGRLDDVFRTLTTAA